MGKGEIGRRWNGIGGRRANRAHNKEEMSELCHRGLQWEMTLGNESAVTASEINFWHKIVTKQVRSLELTRLYSTNTNCTAFRN